MRRIDIDVDAMYGKALGRLGDVGRLLDELRQVRAARRNGGSRPPDFDDEEDGSDDGADDEDTARCLPVDGG